NLRPARPQRWRYEKGLTVRRFSAGAEWIRTFSSAIPRHRRQRGRRHSAVCGGSLSRRKGSIGLLRPTTARMILAPTVNRPQLARNLQTAADLARNSKFESIPLQRTVRVSRDFALPPRKAGLFPRVSSQRGRERP